MNRWTRWPGFTIVAVAVCACGGQVAWSGAGGDGGTGGGSGSGSGTAGSSSGSASSGGSGSGGSSGGSSSGSSSGGIPMDDASTQGAPDATVDVDTSPYDRLRLAVVGDWIGTRTDPWDPPATVTLHLDESGTYRAHCVGGDPSCSVWHYGTDADSPDKTYDLYTVDANGTGEAHIWISWPGESPTQGWLNTVAVDASGHTLTFDFFPTWIGDLGPVHFELTRQ